MTARRWLYALALALGLAAPRFVARALPRRGVAYAIAVGRRPDGALVARCRP